MLCSLVKTKPPWWMFVPRQMLLRMEMRSSIPAGPAGPMTCHLDLSFTNPSPVLAGPHALAGVASVSPPPSAPSGGYLRHSGRLPPDSAMSVPQPAEWSRSLSWSRCGQPFPGPFLPSRAQVGLPGLLLRHKVPVISSWTTSLDPWLWSGRGTDVPAFKLPSRLLVPPPPELELLQRPSRAPWLPCWTSSIADDSRTGSEKPQRLAQFFARTSSEKPFVLPPYPHPHPLPLSLAPFLSCHILFARDIQWDLPAFCSHQVWFMDHRCLNSRCQLPHLLFLPLHLPRRLSRPTRLFRRRPGPCKKFRPSCRTGKTLSSDPWRTRWWICWVLLHPSHLWVPLFLRGLWALMSCGNLLVTSTTMGSALVRIKESGW